VDLEPASRFEWERVICRCRLGHAVQHIALLLAAHADGDGGHVRPGTKRLAAFTGYDVKTIQRSIVKLRNLGLIERVFEASRSGRKGMADEYRLTIPADLAERVEMVDPDGNQATWESSAYLGYPQPGDMGVPWTPCQPGDSKQGPGDMGVPNQGTPVSPHQYIDQPLHQPTSRYLNSAVPVEDVPAEPPVENPDSSSNGSGRPSGLSDEQWDEIRWLADAQKNLTGAKAKPR